MSRCVQRQLLQHCSRSLARSQRYGVSGYHRLHTTPLPLYSSSSTRLLHHTRHLSTATTTASNTAARTTSSSTPVPQHNASRNTTPIDSATREIKVVSYYLSPLELVHLNYPTPTLTFTRPACTLVPLNTPTAATTTPTEAVEAPLTASTFDVYSSFAIVFDYGAIVFFNTTDAQQQAFLPNNTNTTTTTTTATTTTPTTPAAASMVTPTIGSTPSLRLKDDYTVIVNPLTHTHTHQPHNSHTPTTPSTTTPTSALTCAFHTDSVHVSTLDIYSARIIAQILAQTISMEYYEHRTSTMLTEFHALSLHMSNSGTLPASLTAQSSKNLIKLLAQNNTILTSLLTHVRLLDRSEISWRYGQYDALWEGMRREFSIADRYDTLETKLRLLHENHPLFLEVLHHKQGHRMELIIIYLIAIEVILAVVFHSPIVGFVMEELGLAEKGKIRAYD